MSREPSSPSAYPHAVAVHLRVTAGDLVRAARGTDTLAPIPAAVLDLLDRRGPMTTADLAAARRVRHQTMAATVKELIEAGYVATVPDASDGRKKVLHLTAAGSGALNSDRQGRVRHLAEALERTLGHSELQDLANALALIDKVTATLAQDVDAATTPDHGPITGDW
jgi:DNA-binding MarR family transcriptional regulator